jgi:hypothetical protein
MFSLLDGFAGATNDNNVAVRIAVRSVLEHTVIGATNDNNVAVQIAVQIVLEHTVIGYIHVDFETGHVGDAVEWLYGSREQLGHSANCVPHIYARYAFVHATERKVKRHATKHKQGDMRQSTKQSDL